MNQVNHNNDYENQEEEHLNGSNESAVTLKNPNLDSLKEDVLYHLALTTKTHDLKRMFGDVKFVCVGGTTKRMKSFANYVRKELGVSLPADGLQDITEASDRYSMFKIGPILSVMHGMGIPSISILLHELLKLIHYAGCKDVTFFRIGTCGGIGIEPGSVIITKCAVDGLLRPYLEIPVLGRLVRRPAYFDSDLVNELKSIADQEFPHYNAVVGNTMCTLDFYEGQGRLDGAFCDFSPVEQQDYLRELKKAGIANIEMESLAFAAMCHHAGVKCAVVCVSLVDRLREDQVATPKHVMEEWQQRPQELIVRLIKKRMAKFNNNTLTGFDFFMQSQT